MDKLTPQEKYDLLTDENKKIVNRCVDTLANGQEEMPQEEIHARIREIFLAMTDEQRTKALKVMEEITKSEAGE